MPPARRRPYAARLDPEARREQLLDAALTVIAREGHGTLSIEAIAQEAGVTRPVVYGTFDDLGALLMALLDRQEQRALQQLLAALPADVEGADPDVFAVETVRRLIAAVQRDPVTWRPILVPPASTPEVVRARIDGDRDLVRRRVAGLVSTGLQARGGPDLDAEVVAHALVAIAEHFGRLLLTQPERFDADRLVATVERVLALLRA